MGIARKSKVLSLPPKPPSKQRRLEEDGGGSGGEEEENDRDRFLSYFRQSKLPHPDAWPDGSPVFVSASARAPGVTYDVPREQVHAGGAGGHNRDAPSPFPLDGTPVRFEGPRFRGVISSRVRDVPYPLPGGRCDGGNADSTGRRRVGPEEYFRGRSRQYQWTIQGTFRRRTRFDEVVTGQDFDRPFRNAPAGSLVKRALDLLRGRLPETFEYDLLSDRPTFEHPLIAGCQHFRVDRPEAMQGAVAGGAGGGPTTEARIVGEDETGEIVEDSSLLGSHSGVPPDSEGRRKFFAKKENLERFHFEPGLVYTFDFFANFFSPARHRLEVTPFFSLDLIPYFNGYPIFMAMAKEKSSGEYIWATELWHKRLLDYDAKPGVVSRLFSFGSKKSNTKEGAA